MRLTDRERRVEAEKQRKRQRRLDDLASQAAVGLPSKTENQLAGLQRLQQPEVVFSPEAVAIRARKRQEFFDSIFLYMQRYGPTRRGHVEFIEASLSRMKELEVHDDLQCYKALMDVFPKDVMRVRSMWQSEFKHYPRQQDAALCLLDTMNEHRVMPDTEMGLQICRIFGTESYVMAKFQRLMYWMPKLRHADPWPAVTLTSSGLQYLPKLESARDAAIRALRRMCPDHETLVSAYDMDGPPGSDLFVASAQAPAQQRLLGSLSPGAHVYLDGPRRVWFGQLRLGYYTLAADPTPLAREIAARYMAAAPSAASTPQKLRPRPDEENYAWWHRLRCPDDDCFEEQPIEDENELALSASEHELPDQTILALAIASSSAGADLLLRWVRLLAEEPGNEALRQASVVLRLRRDDCWDATEADNQRADDAGNDSNRRDQFDNETRGSSRQS